MMQLPRARWETAWNLWEEMNLKGVKRRFSKREGVDKALMWGAIRKLKKKNEELEAGLKMRDEYLQALLWMPR